jgi:hypothetical protein
VLFFLSAQSQTHNPTPIRYLTPPNSPPKSYKNCPPTVKIPFQTLFGPIRAGFRRNGISQMVFISRKLKIKRRAGLAVFYIYRVRNSI